MDKNQYENEDTESTVTEPVQPQSDDTDSAVDSSNDNSTEENKTEYNNQQGSQQTGSQQGYQQNGYQQNGYQQQGYQQTGYQQQGYQNFQQPNQQTPKKNKGHKTATIIAAVVLGLFFIAGVAGAAIGVVNQLEKYGKENNNKAAWEESAKNEQPDSKDSKKSPIATTEPVSVVQSGDTATGATDVSGIVEAVMPCVVSIQSTSSVDGYSMFGQHYEQQVDSSGTGFIVGQNDTELLFATNNHVVEGATAIQVTFGDDSTAEAIVKGTDAEADLAVVAVELKDVSNDTMKTIKVAMLGDSNEVKVGQMAIAIGNAQGMGQSVTVGYISAKDRKLDFQNNTNGGTKTMTFLQTDAAINGGNSGGPLLDVKGNVVGINSAKISDTQVEGMCYAIPISSAIPIINDLMNRETLKDDEKGYMGVSLQDISDDAVKMYGVPDGVYVYKVSKDSPAEKAGIKEGDIITKINDVTVTSQSATSDKVNSYRAGTEITVSLYRKSGSNNGYEPMDVKVTLCTAEDAGINQSTDNSELQDEPNQDDEKDNQNDGSSGSDDYGYGDQYNGDSGSLFDEMLPW